MYIQKEDCFVVTQVDCSLSTKLELAMRNGVPIPDMSTPKDFGDQPLVPERKRFVESADLYQMEKATKQKFGDLKERYERKLSYRKKLEDGKE